MMKKKYVKPASIVTSMEEQGLICSSVVGVTGTGNMKTVIGSGETDSYLSRHSYLEWDDEDEEDW